VSEQARERKRERAKRERKREDRKKVIFECQGEVCANMFVCTCLCVHVFMCAHARQKDGGRRRYRAR